MLERNFGLRLKYLRTVKNMTQAELAEKTGITVQYLGSIERGLSSPSFTIIAKLCESLETEPANLFLFAPANLDEEEPDAPEPATNWYGFLGGLSCFRIDLESGEELWSNSFNDLLGLRKRQDAPPTLADFLDKVRPEDRYHLRAALEKARSGASPAWFEFKYRRADGEERYGLARIFPQQGADGTPSELIGMILDSTELRHLVRGLLRTQNRLEDHVRASTIALNRNQKSLSRESAARKAVEQELLVTEKIVAASSDPMAYIDRQYRFQGVNQAYEHLAGISRKEIIGRTVAEVMGEEAFARIIKPRLDTALRGEKTRHQEWFRTSGYGKRFMDVSYTPSVEDGRVLGLVQTAHDWTDLLQSKEMESLQAAPGDADWPRQFYDRTLDELRIHQEELRVQNEELKETQVQLRRTTDKYMNLFDGMPLGYAILDSVGSAIEANEAFIAILDRPRRMVLGKTFLNFLSFEDQRKFPSALKAAISGDTRVFKARLDTPRRHTVAELRLSPFTSGHFDKGVCANLLLTDVTAMEDAETRMRLSEAKFKRVIEDTPYGVSITDLQGVFEYVNPAYSQLTGYTQTELIGRPFTLVLPPERHESGAAMHSDFINQKRPDLHGEWQVRHKSGAILDISGTSSRFTGEDGGPRLATFIQDITEQKRLSKIKEDVERIIQHDIRTPLSAIITLPTLLLDDAGLRQEQRELLGYIKEAGYRVLNQINFSLDLYKIETGQFTPRTKPFDLASMLAKLAAEIIPAAGGQEGGVRIAIAAPKQVFVAGDDLLSYYLFSNLLNNAVQASPPGGTVNVLVTEADGRVVAVIHNHGSIPEEIAERFFQKYVTHGKRKGTGLGAYSARLMARAQGGEITVATSQTEGTSLTVVLPGSTGGRNEQE